MTGASWWRPLGSPPFEPAAASNACGDERPFGGGELLLLPGPRRRVRHATQSSLVRASAQPLAAWLVASRAASGEPLAASCECHRRRQNGARPAKCHLHALLCGRLAGWKAAGLLLLLLLSLAGIGPSIFISSLAPSSAAASTGGSARARAWGRIIVFHESSSSPATRRAVAHPSRGSWRRRRRLRLRPRLGFSRQPSAFARPANDGFAKVARAAFQFRQKEAPPFKGASFRRLPGPVRPFFRLEARICWIGILLSAQSAK